jgi:hypothetical protein
MGNFFPFAAVLLDRPACRNYLRRVSGINSLYVTFAGDPDMYMFLRI